MRRMWAPVVAVAVALATVLATAGVAVAYPQRPAVNQKAVEQVIARAVAQRGVPFTYGGGDATGPTKGRPQAPPAAAPGLTETVPAVPGSSPLIPGLDVPPSPGLVLGGQPSAGAAAVDQQAAQQAAEQANVVGFDASGLMVYAFAGVGVKLPRSSGEQYRVSQKVAPSQALPGDLIFYGPEGTQSVALFIGNGQMVEVGTQGVAVSPVRTNDMTPYLGRIIA
ncbi:NlpC/P60 family peptidoglycan-binding protein RipD [Mycobacterium sp. ACS4331]|uniref:NlpC/P60 family peptidoglycan-binding protein RipD n=1 Tax=Mycobacterium sp. ACS4331 TaxID=1834121 RepID=UPI0008012C2D|nr:NlpC/P60 family peptidoglycan-binding protein RipD [Mycobacterium sp. ACS4331]OBF11338.1 hydrolase [Mycobacterium sp. ACS4331]